MVNPFEAPATHQEANFIPPRRSEKEGLRIVESIRLFFPLIMTVFIACALTGYFVSILHETSSSLEESKEAFQENIEVYSNFSDEKKLIHAKIIIEDDFETKSDFNDTLLNMIKGLKLVLIILLAGLTIQFFSLISYYRLERKFVDAINRNSLWVSIWSYILIIAWGVYVLNKQNYWSESPDLFWEFVGATVVTLFLLWAASRKNFIAASALFVICLLSFGYTILYEDLKKMLFPMLHLYLTSEIALSVYLLNIEQKNHTVIEN